MSKSPLPAGLKIRVLTTIEDGEITQETLHDDHLVATASDFITVAHQTGFIVSRNLFKREWADALSQANDARGLPCQWRDSLGTPDDRERAHEIIELVSEAIASLKEINIGE